MLDCSYDEPLAFCIVPRPNTASYHGSCIMMLLSFSSCSLLRQLVVICFEKPTMLTKNNSPGSCVLNPAATNHAISQFPGRSTNHTGPREKLRISASKRLMKIDNLN